MSSLTKKYVEVEIQGGPISGTTSDNPITLTPSVRLSCHVVFMEPQSKEIFPLEKDSPKICAKIVQLYIPNISSNLKTQFLDHVKFSGLLAAFLS